MAQPTFAEIMAEADMARVLVEKSNKELLLSINPNYADDFNDMMYDCQITDLITVVDGPSGDPQEESYGIFKNVHVDQFGNSLIDSYSGFIYAEFETGKWIKVPYQC